MSRNRLQLLTAYYNTGYGKQCGTGIGVHAQINGQSRKKGEMSAKNSLSRFSRLDFSDL